MSPAIEPVAQWARSFGHAGYLVWLLVWAMPVLLGQWIAFPGFLARTLSRWLPLALLMAAWFGFADAIGIASGVWRISEEFTLGLRLGEIGRAHV